MKSIKCILLGVALVVASFSVMAEPSPNNQNSDLIKLSQQLAKLQKLSDNAGKVTDSQDSDATLSVAQNAKPKPEDVNLENNSLADNNQSSDLPSNKDQPTDTQSNNLPKSAQQVPVSQQAFAGVLNQRLPLTPDQIRILHKAFDDAQRAAAEPAHAPAKPTASAIAVNLAPDATPPVIRLGAGYITSLVFVDGSGQPWPIKAYSVGNPEAFNIQWDQKGNTLLVQADTFYKRSNLAVMLAGLNTPIMLTLLPGQTAVDYRVDLRVPGLGPNAMLLHAGFASSNDSVMLTFLNGVPPKGAKSVQIHGDDSSQAWIFNKLLYLRTSLDVISPAWQAIMSSSDGTHIYRLEPTSVVLAVEHGKDRVMKLVVDGE
ncbi:MAG: type IV secretion protein IcmK [Gammaproteobacteria bacterium]|nr:type IV secretion protein IcmK [Gammaproteobacteria bacterium]